MSGGNPNQAESDVVHGGATDTPMQPKRYRCADVIRLPAGAGLALVCCRANRANRLLPSSTADLLNYCATFRSLDEHAHAISMVSELSRDRADALMWGLSSRILSTPITRQLARYRDFMRKRKGTAEVNRLNVDLIKHELVRLAEAGLLVSDADIIANYRQLQCGQPVPRGIATVGVVTRDRPESLSRCLTGYIESVKRHGRKCDFVVVDDSKDPSFREDTRQVLLRMKAKYGVEVAYAGLEEKKRFADALQEKGGLPADVVSFALFGLHGCEPTAGANRNALMLHTAGDMLFSADDDTVCNVAAPPGTYLPGLTFHSGTDPTDFWFFTDRRAALESVNSVEQDILSAHEQLLGKPFSMCIAQQYDPSTVSLDEADPQLLRELHQGGGKTLVTMTGLVGDSGMWSPLWYLRLRGESRERLTESKPIYESAFSSREVLRVARRMTISSEAFCMAYAVGLDNREILPPFLPSCRNQDGLFGGLLRVCFESGYFSHVPYAIKHLPPHSRIYSKPEVWEQAARYRFCDTILACLQSHNVPFGMTCGEDRLRAVGQHLIHLGDLPAAAFDEFVRFNLWHANCVHISSLEEQLVNYKGTPDYWADDVRRLIEVLRQSLTQVDLMAPQDLVIGRSVEEARRQAQHLVHQFGQLLYWWPEIVKSAKSLRAQGIRLGVTL